MKPSLFVAAALAGLMAFMNSSPAFPYSQTNYTTAYIPSPLESRGHSPRALGMSSAFTAVEGDLSCLYFNPAGLAGLKTPGLSLSHQAWISDITQETLQGAFPLPQAGAFCIGANYLDFGSLDGYDSTGSPTLSYHPSRFSLTLGWGGNVLPTLDAGLSVRGLYQSLVSGMDGLASSLSVGFLWRIMPSLKAGGFYSFLESDTSPELGQLKWGVSWLPFPADKEPLLLAADFSMPPHGLYLLQGGAEKPLFSVFVARLGWQTEFLDNQVSGFRGLSCGLGLRLSDLDLDYGFAPDGDLGASQMIGLTWRFPAASTPSKAVTASSPAPKPAFPPSPLGTPNPSSPPVGIFPFTPALVPPAAPLAAPTPTPSTAPLVFPETRFKPSDQVSPNDRSVSVEMQFKFPKQGAKTGAAPLATPSPQLEQDIQALAQKVQADPTNAQAWQSLGNLYWQAGQPDYAVQCFQEALQLRPENEPLRNWLDRYKRLHPDAPGGGE